MFPTIIFTQNKIQSIFCRELMTSPHVNEGRDILQILSAAADMLNPYAASINFNRILMRHTYCEIDLRPHRRIFFLYCCDIRIFSKL
jgi:hypothetical protein